MLLHPRAPQPVVKVVAGFQGYNRSHFFRRFSISKSLAAKPLPPRPKLDDRDITGSYLKGSGPGGQKINKTNSAVQLIHKPTGIVVKSQATRSRSQNQKIAREILAEKVERLAKGEESRTAIKTTLKRKRKASKMKKSRRKYRALEEVKRGEGEGKEKGGPIYGEGGAAEATAEADGHR